MGAIRERRRLILIGLVILVLVCLVAVLIFRIFTEGDNVAGGTPTPSATPTEEGPVVIVTPEEVENTPTPTRVISEQPTTPATTEPTTEPTSQPASPTPTATRGTAVASEFTVSTGTTTAPRIANLLENGDFEASFNDQGVASKWTGFHNDGVIASFSRETPGPHVEAGSSAQRISLAGATQPDRYAGIFQQVEVVPNRTYTLELHGQIRTGFADVNQSGYGYRMQYAIDHKGRDNWRAIPPERWVELPWDEQPLNAAGVQFLDYTTQITPTSNKITLFIRAWNKWPDPGLAEYTLDSLSLTGPVPGSVVTTGTEEALVDGGLPKTGAGDSMGLMDDGRFWGAVLVLILLAAGAIYRGKWGY